MGTFMYVLAATCDADNAVLSPTCHAFSYSATVCTGLAAAAITAIVVNTFRAPVISRECSRQIADSPLFSSPANSEDEKELVKYDAQAETFLRRQFGFSAGGSRSCSSVTSEQALETPAPPALLQDVLQPGGTETIADTINLGELPVENLTPEQLEERTQLIERINKARERKVRAQAIKLKSKAKADLLLAQLTDQGE